MTFYKLAMPLDMPTVCHDSCMTAILLSYTPEGFVIGADGRRTDGEKVVSDETRKIYAVKSGSLAGAFAWSGNTVIHREGKPAFDFAKATSVLLPTIPSSSFPELVQMFCQALSSALSAFAVFGFPTGKANLLIAAYFGDEPWIADIQVPFQNGQAQKPFVERQGQPSVGRTFLFSGSKAIADQVWQGGEPPIVQSSEEAVELIRRYITACSENPNADTNASMIGGHIHIAVVRPDKLKWIDLPPAQS